MFFFRRSKKTRRSHPAVQKRRSVRRLPLSLEVLESRVLLDAYQWHATGSGNWNDSSNWVDLSTGKSNSVPGSSDTVAIETSNALTITIPSGYHADVQNVTTGSNDTLSIQGGSLDVEAGSSTLNGPLAMSGGFLYANGSANPLAPASLTAKGATTIVDANLFVFDGATLSLPQLTSYTADNNSFQAGAGGTLNLPALQSVTQNGSWTINASDTSDSSGDGGTINLSGLSSLRGSSAGALTVNDASNDGNNQLQIGSLGDSLSGANINVDNADLQTAMNALTAITNSQVTISGFSYSLSGLNDVDGSTLDVTNSGPNPGTLNLTSSGFSVENSTIKVEGGSSLVLGSSTTPTLNGDWTLDASGGQLSFPSVANVSGTGSITLNLDDGTSSIELSEPNNQSATVGQTATFTAPASGNPSPSIQWQLSTDDGKTWSDINGATNATLKLKNVSLAMNGYQYRAVISNSVVNASDSAFSIASDAATLTVGNAPSVTTNPTNQTVNAGRNVNCTAAANGSPAPAVQWQVSTDGGKTFSNINGATSTTLTLTSVTASMDDYEYRAVFTNSFGSATTSAAILTVDAAPSVTANPSNQTVNPGQNIAFTAAAGGNPSPTVQWQVSTDGGKTFHTISGATNATLVLTSVTAAMNGNEYEAVFSNSVGSTTTSVAALTVETTVSPPPPVQTLPPPPSLFQLLVTIYLDLEALTFSSDPSVFSYLNSISESMVGQPLPPAADLVPTIEADFTELENLLFHGV